MPDDMCTVVRLTEEQDMTTKSGYEYAMDKIREYEGCHISLWGSIPCTGGSPWQYVAGKLLRIDGSEGLANASNGSASVSFNWARGHHKQHRGHTVRPTHMHNAAGQPASTRQ